MSGSFLFEGGAFGSLRSRAEPGNEGRASSELDVSRVYVCDVDSKRFEGGEDTFDVWPVVFERHRFHFFPIGQTSGE